MLPAALPGGSRVTFEPGGQLELSGPVAPSLRDRLRGDARRHRARCGARSITTTSTSSAPRSTPAATLPRVLDAPRYRAMEEYFDARWPAGRTMMRNTASIQVNLDAGSPATVDARWHLAHDLGPVLSACFANSPFDPSGTPTGFRSTRSAVWHDHRPGPHRLGAPRRGDERAPTTGPATCSPRR